MLSHLLRLPILTILILILLLTHVNKFLGSLIQSRLQSRPLSRLAQSVRSRETILVGMKSISYRLLWLFFLCQAALGNELRYA